MPRGDAPPLTRGVVLRGVLLAVAVALGGVAAWLIVTSTTQKRIELGVLAGLWAALVAAFAMFGSRRLMHPIEASYPDPAVHSAELELRTTSHEIERAQEAAARRAHEARLEHMLRAEIHSAISREVGTLRAEIAELRSELLEKVGGQLRLERIETTRVIGSDLEALQHEVRQLKTIAQDAGELGATTRVRSESIPMRPIVEAARVRPVSRETAEVEADVQPARVEVQAPAADAPDVHAPDVHAPDDYAPDVQPLTPTHPLTPAQPTTTFHTPAPPPPAPPPATFVTPPPPPPPPQPVFVTPPPPVQHPAPAKPAAAQSASQPTPPPASQPTPPPAPRPARESSSRFDDFAALPRIRPFTDFELDPIADEPAYTGRRRRSGAEEGDGKHVREAESGRRHARDDEDGNDLLARLLARETSR